MPILPSPAGAEAPWLVIHLNHLIPSYPGQVYGLVAGQRVIVCGDVCVCKGMNDLRYCELHCGIQELFLKSEGLTHQSPTDNEGVLIP